MLCTNAPSYPVEKLENDIGKNMPTRKNDTRKYYKVQLTAMVVFVPYSFGSGPKFRSQMMTPTLKFVLEGSRAEYVRVYMGNLDWRF